MMSAHEQSAAETAVIRRVQLRLRAGIVGFDTEPDLAELDPLSIPTSITRALRIDPVTLLTLRVRDDGMAPMFFEDDWVVIDTEDTTRRSGEVYALNWNGEACIAQLASQGGQWYLNYVNTAFKRINVRSGDLRIVGRVVYQPARIVAGRL